MACSCTHRDANEHGIANPHLKHINVRQIWGGGGGGRGGGGGDRAQIGVRSVMYCEIPRSEKAGRMQ